ERVRHALRQLAEGLCSLHRAGKLHCDIKPSNLRVTAEGRLVLLDFGLVHDLAGQMFHTMVGEVRGTPAYMSPEQALGRDVSEASDWYAVGGVLYEALTGELPFQGSVLEVLKAKQRDDGPSPRRRVPYLPDDLAELSQRLLRRDSAARPKGKEILELLGGGWTGLPELTTTRDSRLFVGRELQLAALDEAFELPFTGQAVSVFVRGASGMGKTALVGRFLDQARRKHPKLVVLAGRCYERESVPYKGLDALIDALSRYLKHLAFDEATALVPPQAEALTRLFPALRRVEAVAESISRSPSTFEASDQVSQVRSALRELLERVAQRVPLILFIDDLQWGDRESAELLADLLSGSNPPPLMLIGCYREGLGEHEPLLASLLTRSFGQRAQAREIQVQELWFSEACELALKLLGERRSPALALARAIARESKGSPFFIDEMVRYATSELDSSPGVGGASVLAAPLETSPSGLSLESLIRARLARLSTGARRLLELLAVAGRPVAFDVAVRAAELERDTQTVLKSLLSGSLVRMIDSPQRELETHHDRIREAILAELDEARRAGLHGRLAAVLEESQRADPETLALHFYMAGDSRRATELAKLAADNALGELAFDRAARLLQLALDLEPESKARCGLLVDLGFALVNAGRRPQAGDAYLEAADASSGAQALELRRRACQQQFFGGDFEGCRRSLQAILTSVNVAMPAGRARTLASLGWCRLHLRLLGFRRLLRGGARLHLEAMSHVPSPAQAWRLDVLWSAFVVCLRNPLRALDFLARYQKLALEVGQPIHRLHAVALEVSLSASRGVRAAPRTTRLLRTMNSLAEQIGDASALAEASYASGLAALLESRLQDASDLFEKSEDLWRQSSTDFFWGASQARAERLQTLILRGRLRAVIEHLPKMLRDVAAKGNLYDETDLRSRAAWVVRLAADQPREAMKEIHKAQALLERQMDSKLWDYSGFHLLHFQHLLGRVEILIYRGRDLEAARVLEDSWRRLRRSIFFRAQILRTEALGLRGRVAVAAAAALGRESRATRALLRRAQRSSNRLRSEQLMWADAMASLIDAGRRSIEGRPSEVIDKLAKAAAGFETARFELSAAACRYRRGQLDPAAYRGELDLARAWMAGEGVARPSRMMAVLAPGLWSPRSEGAR
ncbi:MAG: AAA family ATPase, partial [Acidobacteriota bacterium]